MVELITATGSKGDPGVQIEMTHRIKHIASNPKPYKPVLFCQNMKLRKCVEKIGFIQSKLKLACSQDSKTSNHEGESDTAQKSNTRTQTSNGTQNVFRDTLGVGEARRN